MTIHNPCKPAPRDADKIVIRDIGTGQVIASNFTKHIPMYTRAAWVRQCIADHYACSADDITTEIDGRYEIDGIPMAYIEGEYEPLVEMIEAAE